MTRTTFLKNAVTPKLFGIFEFCKRHCIRNRSGRLVVKFYQMKLKSDFLKKYFHFLINWMSFQGQGHFGALGVIFSFHSSMPIIIYRFYRSHGICAILAVIGLIISVIKGRAISIPFLMTNALM